MTEQQPPIYNIRNVRKETLEHYLGGWPLSADLRRNIYLKYAQQPEELRDPRYNVEQSNEMRNVWAEIADIIIDEIGTDNSDKIGIDVAMSSGYFAEKLLQKGYQGRLVGVDLEAGHLPLLQDLFSEWYPGPELIFGKADAQSLRKIAIQPNEDLDPYYLKLKKSSFDFLTELFVLYHIEDRQKAYQAASRVLKPGGLAVFSSRGRLNQTHVWNIANPVASVFGAEIPSTFYDVYDLDMMEEDLNNSKNFNVIYKSVQANNLWIPNNDEGWGDYRLAILSLLPMMKHKLTGRQLNGYYVGKYLDEFVREHLFESQAKNNGTNGKYFIDIVHQGYFVCENIK